MLSTIRDVKSIFVGVRQPSEKPIFIRLDNTTKPMLVFRNRAIGVVTQLKRLGFAISIPENNFQVREALLKDDDRILVLYLSHVTRDFIEQNASAFYGRNTMMIYYHQEEIPRIRFACRLEPQKLVLYHGAIEYPLKV